MDDPHGPVIEDRAPPGETRMLVRVVGIDSGDVLYSKEVTDGDPARIGGTWPEPIKVQFLTVEAGGSDHG